MLLALAAAAAPAQALDTHQCRLRQTAAGHHQHSHRPCRILRRPPGRMPAQPGRRRCHARSMKATGTSCSPSMPTINQRRDPGHRPGALPGLRILDLSQWLWRLRGLRAGQAPRADRCRLARQHPADERGAPAQWRRPCRAAWCAPIAATSCSTTRTAPSALWNETPYHFIKRQSQADAGKWVDMIDDRPIIVAAAN